MARKSSVTRKMQWVLTKPTNRFSVRVRRSWGLLIGFSAPESPLENGNGIHNESFFLSVFSNENAVVSVEKDFEQNVLIFRVNGREPSDAKGRRETHLTDEQFGSLVGAVQMGNKDDEVEIVQ